jgi:hypothetical protein
MLLVLINRVEETILFMDHDLEKASNMKLLFCAFKQELRLKIIFHISDCFALENRKNQFINIINYLTTTQELFR